MTPPPLAPPCRACGTPRVGPHCHACGQAVHDEQPLTMRRLVRDYAERITSLDRPLLHTARAMAHGPGTVSRRYLDGERHAFLSPLATFALAVVLYLATYVLYGEKALHAALAFSGRALSAQSSDPVVAAMQAELEETTRRWTAWLVANMKYLMLLAVLPLAVALRWVMPRRFTTGEWCAAMLYAFALYLAVTAIVVPLLYLLPPSAGYLATLGFTNGLLFGLVLWTTQTMMDRRPGTTLHTVFSIGVAVAMVSLAMTPFVVAMAWQTIHRLGVAVAP